MAAEIEEAWKYMYQDNIRLALQQKMPKIAKAGVIRVESAGGEGFRPEMSVAAGTYQQRTVRNELKTVQELALTGRWVEPTDYDIGPYHDDKIDKIRTGIEMTGTYTQSSVATVNRLRDDVVLAAMFGSAKTGKNGTGSAATFDTSNMRVASGSANMTVAKLIEAREKLIKYENDLDAETPYVAMTEKQWRSLMNDMKMISGDFNNNKPLEKGVVEAYVGFNIIVFSSARLTYTSSSDRRCPFWVPSGVFLADYDLMMPTIRKATEFRGEPYEVYTMLTLGATRLDEKKVGEILCTES